MRANSLREKPAQHGLSNGMTHLRPTQDHLLVRPVKRKQSDIVHVVSHEKFTQGVVAAVGPGRPNKKGVIRPLTVKPGDFITYGCIERGYDFYPIYEEGGVRYRILQEADVAFIADPDAPEHGFRDDEIARLVTDARVLEIAA
jgi:co-chaperonin GroES (HSP10)